MPVRFRPGVHKSRVRNRARAKFGTLLFFVYPSLKQSEKESAAAERAMFELWFFLLTLCPAGLDSQKEKQSGERGLSAQVLYHGIKHPGQFICFQT